MKQKKTLVLLTLATLSLTVCVGCKKTQSEQSVASLQQKIDNEISLANDHLNQGQPKTALSILEKLEHSHPDQASVLEALAFAHSAQGDHELSAFYFDQVFRLDPSHVEACLFAADGYKELGQWDMAIKNYEIYVQTYPKDPAVWKTMADLYETLDRLHSALKAFTTYTKIKESSVTAEEFLKLAKLNTQLGNVQQAESWYTAALQEEAYQEEALFGLLQINLLAQDWPAIQNIVLILDEVSPTALNNSSFSGIRADLKDWQEDLNAQTNKKAETEIAQMAAVDAHSESANKQNTAIQQWINKTQKNKLARKWKKKNAKPTESPAAEEFSAEAFLKQEPTAVAQTEAPTQWANDPSLDKVETVDKTLQLIFHSIVSHSHGAKIADKVITTEENPFLPDAIRNIEAPTRGITAQDITALPPRQVQQQEAPKPTPEEFFAEGKNFKSLGKYEDAIQEYWQALALDDSPATSWNELAETYLLDNQFEEAEMTSLEALRRDPSNIQYTLNFLRAVHKTKPSSTFLTELTKAEQRFPKSPEITLALARVYDSDAIEQNPRKAASYYNKFVQQYPNHPKSSEALAALHRLQ